MYVCMYVCNADDVTTDELRQKRKEVDFLKQAKSNHGFGTHTTFNLSKLNICDLKFNFQFSI